VLSSVWEKDEVIKGTDGSQFEPNLSTDVKVYVWSPDFLRSGKAFPHII
jgi:hypothetical protein